MIRLAGGSVKVYTSATLTLPNFTSGPNTATYVHTENHDLEAIPDRVDIIFTGDASESADWWGPKGPYGQAPDVDYTFHPSWGGEAGLRGASCYDKSTTQFKVVFQSYMAGEKVYFKAYLLGGVHRAE